MKTIQFMKITEKQYGKIEPILPKQRGNVRIDNLTFINALLYICENGCKWRGLPEKFEYWHVVYKRFNRWVKAGIIDRLFRELHVQDVLSTASLALFLDSMMVKVHPDACGALKKRQTSTRPFKRRADHKSSSYGCGRENRRGVHSQ
jgi:transposase